MNGCGRDREHQRANTVSSQEQYAAAVVEILQSIRQADMTPLLQRIYDAPGGVEQLDVLMKYLYVSTWSDEDLACYAQSVRSNDANIVRRQ